MFYGCIRRWQDCVKKYNVEYIDLTEPIRLDFEKNGKKFNAKFDNHWNLYGHSFVAGVLFDYLCLGNEGNE